MTREQEKKFTKLIQPLVEEIVKKQKLSESHAGDVVNELENIIHKYGKGKMTTQQWVILIEMACRNLGLR